MKKIMFILFILSAIISAQEYSVEKVSGNVQALIGTGENWMKVSVGQKLHGTDLILTDDKSFVQLANKESRFVLQSNSALGLNAIKKMSLNELLLALAMEEIRNVPKTKGSSLTRNTAVYGSEVDAGKPAAGSINDIGIKKLNGAMQLAQNGFKESAILVAKETYRKYPETKNQIRDRIYFADLMLQMNLLNEAETELNSIIARQLNPDDRKEITNRLDKIKEATTKK